jgi:15-cis-phytoene synthase
MSLLEQSYTECEHVAKTQARNFYYSFLTLPPEKKAAMCAIYAFFRYSDDVSDEAAEDGDKAGKMRAWRSALDRAMQGDYGDSKILPAFHDTVKKYGIPAAYFYELIDGTEMDLTKNRYSTFDELHLYCYRVASLVGFVCIYVWGFDQQTPDSLRYAESCGLAFQITNILRDVKEDAERDRVYLPQEDLDRFGVSVEDLKAGVITEKVRSLLKFEAERAANYYSEAQKLVPLLHRDGRATYAIMNRIYRGILDNIVERNYDVFSGRARISTLRKLSIVLGAWVSSRLSKS